MPSKIENGTFYHAGETLSARIVYKLKAKMVLRSESQQQRRAVLLSRGIMPAQGDLTEHDDDDEPKTYKANTAIKVCNYFRYVTIQKVLYDETHVARFMCFGGGSTNVEAEYVRDTFCVHKDKLR